MLRPDHQPVAADQQERADDRHRQERLRLRPLAAAQPAPAVEQRAGDQESRPRHGEGRAAR